MGKGCKGTYVKIGPLFLLEAETCSYKLKLYTTSGEEIQHRKHCSGGCSLSGREIEGTPGGSRCLIHEKQRLDTQNIVLVVAGFVEERKKEHVAGVVVRWTRGRDLRPYLDVHAIWRRDIAAMWAELGL